MPGDLLVLLMAVAVAEVLDVAAVIPFVADVEPTLYCMMMSSLSW